ncbi:hypothetical protein V1264_011268 [Littorina saxatilis]|uniref:Uncharacterized protein n=1 Tax=Littorina saxatilis TaxID=31220 RepID=A0AAN9BUK0_9CAEN
MSELLLLPDTVSVHVPPLYLDLTREFSRVLMFFFCFAWKVKIRLPTLLTVAFLAFDIRVRVEIEVQF